jgi:hypothetical protein
MLKCKKCERGPKYNKAHHPTCKQSNAYKFKLKNGGRAKKLVSDERRGQTNPFTRADGDAFFQPRVSSSNGAPGAPTAQDTSPQQNTSPAQQDTSPQDTIPEVVPPKEPENSFPDNLFSPEMLKVAIQKRVKIPSY